MEISPTRNLRRTKIIFTIGPATDSEEMLRSLIRDHYVDICRINMAHASHDYVRTIVKRVRKVSAEVGREIAVMMDVKGPEVRTGDVDAPIELQPGEIFDFTIKPSGDIEREEEIRSVAVNYAELVNDVEVGSVVLVDNGLIRLEVLEKRETLIRCKVIIAGELTSRRHINLPGVKVNLPALTKKDEGDTLVGIEAGVDFYALSFVREGNDLKILRKFLDDNNAPDARMIAKIEDQQAIRNLEEIVVECDALMVARGDLGIECPFETLPLIQRRAVKECIRQRTPVIIATHMLESMISNPMPTRAEVTDVANAVLEQADCVMLSGETTVGKYPVECVDALRKISKSVDTTGTKSDFASFVELTTDKQKLQHSAVTMANQFEAAAIICFTRTGSMAEGVAALRPQSSPIFAFTNSDTILKHLRINHGVIPFVADFDGEPASTVENAIKFLKSEGFIIGGEKIVVVSDILAADRVIDSVQLRQVD
ncbi:pyruvate kinase [Puniceicoccaceae bacterium K14]|nr:pyruvate kinase [Puniceicoccaceae bacterium K14]